MMTIYKFQAELEIIGINPFVAVPPDILQHIFIDSGREKSPLPFVVRLMKKLISKI
ncbi:hypothetical protein ICE98_02018 [Lactococcus lactis]|nr:hypothetical protein [Lactococcus lactis]